MFTSFGQLLLGSILFLFGKSALWQSKMAMDPPPVAGNNWYNVIWCLLITMAGISTHILTSPERKHVYICIGVCLQLREWIKIDVYIVGIDTHKDIETGEKRMTQLVKNAKLRFVLKTSVSQLLS